MQEKEIRQEFMENNTFTYQYSAKTNKEVEAIRSRYLPHEASKLEKLRKLDFKAQSAGQIESLCLGVIGCLIFGIGMCFGLDVFAGGDWLTAIFCVIGTLVMIPAYPVYKRISKKIKSELTPEILRLSEEIMKS